MKKLGLIGGTTWLSTAEYYRNLNILANERLGGSEFPELVIESLNFGELARNQVAGEFAVNEGIVVAAAKRLAASGAAGIGLLANTMHLFAPAVEKGTGLPVVHIARATGQAVRAAGISKVGLLGTRVTMEKDIYFSIFREMGIAVVVPQLEEDLVRINDSIFQELARDVFTDEMRAYYLTMIDNLKAQGAEGVILGCTEIPLLLSPDQIPMPSFDTVKIHSEALVGFVLADTIL